LPGPSGDGPCGDLWRVEGRKLSGERGMGSRRGWAWLGEGVVVDRRGENSWPWAAAASPVNMDRNIVI
jgi:hypothetical protein